MNLFERLAARIPAPNCCPHPDIDDDQDTAPTDTTNRDHRGSTR